MTRTGFAWALAILLAAPARSQAQVDEIPETSCRAGSFVREGVPLRLGTARLASGDPPLFLLADEGECPAGSSDTCRIGTALEPQESLIVSHGFLHFVCAARTAGGAVKSVGWLPRRSVRTADVDPDPPLDEWPGAWVGGAGAFSIRPGVSPGLLEVEGTALAGEGIPTDAAAWLNGAARPIGQALTVTDEFGSGCSVTLRLVGRLLFANQTGECAAPARFDGVYVRREAAR